MSTDNFGPELFEAARAYVDDINEGEAEYTSIAGIAVDNRMLYATLAQVFCTRAQLALNLTLAEVIAQAAHVRHPDLDAWRKVIPAAPPQECWSFSERRPECAERHTEDCAYADPVPEPEHVLLPVGTRVLISEKETREGWTRYHNPVAGRISGYDMSRSKYQWQAELGSGSYTSHSYWTGVGNHVEIHPNGPECTPEPERVKREPSGPRIYVQHYRGKQGHVVEVSSMNGELMFRVQWYTPGSEPVWKTASSLAIIPVDRVARCPYGQTGDECGSGENQCELCLAAEDEEADTIEESMGLR